MACTTILVGKKATYDGSTMVARNEDSGAGEFGPKKMVVIQPHEQPKLYRSVLSHVEIPLADEPMRYTCMPDAITGKGNWAAFGVNELNVSMTATETITSNERVLAADPLVKFVPAKGVLNEEGYEPEIPGGIGEEDIVSLVLPYIHSAREGVTRLGAILERYGTYEMNGIAFQDVDEIWWLETIGGHHWMAKRVPDDSYVVMPNQLGIDSFDFKDALGKQKNYMCSKDLLEFVEKHHLNLSMNNHFDPRAAFGSHSDADHIYNTPRAWVMCRYFNPTTYTWNGAQAQFKPESDNLPWSLVPEKKITVEDIKYILSNHYQGTPYDPYGKHGDSSMRGSYRPIGVNRTNFLGLVQIRPYVPEAIRSVQWIAFGSNVFNTFVPQYSNVNVVPEYISNTTKTVTTDNFYWASRLVGALADSHFNACASPIERYQLKTQTKANELLLKYDAMYDEKKPVNELCEVANEALVAMVKESTDQVLDQVLFTSSSLMKNAFSRSDA